MACRGCHTAKVKCSKTSPCVRCVRLDIDCVPHASRQGQGKKRKASNSSSLLSEKHHKVTVDTTDEDSIPEDSSNLVFERGVLCRSTRLGPQHYGLHLILRQWISIAFTRRSFGLLAKAAALAKKTGILMDEIISGENMPPTWASTPIPRMEFLPAIILEPTGKQKVAGPRLHFSDIPEVLLLAVYCSHPCDKGALKDDSGAQKGMKGSQKGYDYQHLGDRLIMIKEMKCGVNRFFASSAFERDICSWETIQETWKANQKMVMDIFLPHSEVEPYGRGLTHQISLHSNPNSPPSPTRLPTTSIRLLSGQIQQADCVICLHVVDLDQAFMYVEYVPVVVDKKAAVMSPSLAVVDKRLQTTTAHSDRIDDPFFLDKITFMDWSGDLDEWVHEIAL